MPQPQPTECECFNKGCDSQVVQTSGGDAGNDDFFVFIARAARGACSTDDVTLRIGNQHGTCLRNKRMLCVAANGAEKCGQVFGP
jgi:hypothetical protein